MPSPEDSRLPGGEELFELVRLQVSLGPRYPGSPGHRSLIKEIASRLETGADQVLRQQFSVPLPGGRAACTNLIGVFRARMSSGPVAPLLLGTHFDTRLTADRESDAQLRALPIPGANDGGSGTAVLLRLLPLLQRLKESALERDILVAFFDAEDVGGINGLPFSLGARLFVDQPPCRLPAEVLVLDMVGGKDLILDVDAHVLEHPSSLRLTHELFQLGLELGYVAFSAIDERPAPLAGRCKWKHIICDHYPFMQSGIPSCLLIDLDYPQWHTHADLPEAMSGRSLLMIFEVVLRYVSKHLA